MPLLFIIIIIIIIKRVSSVRLSLLPVGTVEHPPSFHFFPHSDSGEDKSAARGRRRGRSQACK
jgi:hypothetical protein